MAEKYTQKEIIEKFKKIHGNKYGYDKFIYINSLTKGIITCFLHGDFQQTPKSHFNGAGCIKCGFEKLSILFKSNKEEFEKKARLVHNNRYRYDKFIYVNSLTKGIIICNSHGDFEQTPGNHLSGVNCPKCELEKISKLFKSNKEEFEIKARKKHRNKYQYDKFIYVNNKTKGIITCLIDNHGDFEQKPNCHLNGRGCPKCQGLYRTTEEVIILFNKKHNNRYTYEKFIYQGSTVKGIITCDLHGDFEQTPHDHLKGHGCPKCKRSKGELIIEDFLKKNNIDFEIEYTIPGCNKKYRYDFYLPRYKLFIEFHGGQHFMFIKHFHNTKEGFENQIFRDEEKKELARYMGYKLIVSNYKHLKAGILIKFITTQLKLKTTGLFDFL